MSRSRTSHRGRPYNPVHYQSSRRRHISLPTEETFTEIHERMRMACNDEKVRVKGRREPGTEMEAESEGHEKVKMKGRTEKDFEKNLPEVFEDKVDRVRVKGRREMRDEIQPGTEVLQDSLTLERVKGRREMRDGVQPGTEILQDSLTLERVKGRRETRDMVLVDRTNTGKQSVLQVTDNLSCIMKKPTFWFPTWSDTNQAVQLQKMTRGLKFRI